MSKKYFSFVTLIGALLIYSIIIIMNYHSDLTRVLHHDYNYVYEKFHSNKLFLKTLYLLDNKKKYDTLVYGSSRGGFMDVSLVSPRAYNMSHGFGTVTTYLDNLKTLLAEDIHLKEVWIGINDFIIWKDQTHSLVKKAYHHGLFGNILLYSDWLFTMRPNNIKINYKNIPLVKSDYITNPKTHVEHARKQAKKLTNSRDIPPTTLGYTGIFRVDQAVEEIKEIKQLCHDNNITFTAFMYPIYYKTYLRYNQNKIEEFKRKLAQVTDFYDFYDLDTIAINKRNWFEGSHFIPAVGDYIIKSIHEGKHHITKDNVDARIKQTRSHIVNMARVSLGDAYQYNPHIDLSPFKIIFDLNNKNVLYFKNDEFELTHKENAVALTVTKPDPIMILNHTKTEAKQVSLTVAIECDRPTIFQLFYKENPHEDYGEKHNLYLNLKKGLNTFRITLLGKYINNELRIDPVSHLGKYKIKKFILRALQ